MRGALVSRIPTPTAKTMKPAPLKDRPHYYAGKCLDCLAVGKHSPALFVVAFVGDTTNKEHLLCRSCLALRNSNGLRWHIIRVVGRRSGGVTCVRCGRAGSIAKDGTILVPPCECGAGFRSVPNAMRNE